MWRWAWVDEACGFFDKERAGTLKQTDVYLFRVAQMLEDYAVHGAVLRRYSRSVSRLDGPGAEAIVRFQAWLRSAGRFRHPQGPRVCIPAVSRQVVPILVAMGGASVSTTCCAGRAAVR